MARATLSRPAGVGSGRGSMLQVSATFPYIWPVPVTASATHTGTATWLHLLGVRPRHQHRLGSTRRTVGPPRSHQQAPGWWAARFGRHQQWQGQQLRQRQRLLKHSGACSTTCRCVTCCVVGMYSVWCCAKCRVVREVSTASPGPRCRCTKGVRPPAASYTLRRCLTESIPCPCSSPLSCRMRGRQTSPSCLPLLASLSAPGTARPRCWAATAAFCKVHLLPLAAGLVCMPASKCGHTGSLLTAIGTLCSHFRVVQQGVLASVAACPELHLR